MAHFSGMCKTSLSEALGIHSDPEKTKVNLLQAQLEEVPDSFFALFWLYTHDFLFISRNIEKVTGHEFSNFENHGMVFFTSLIPPDLIDTIYQTMNAQADAIHSHPEHLFAEEYLHIEAAVYDEKKNKIPVNYNAVLMDEKVFDPISYLVLCSWIDTRDKSEDLINAYENEVKNKLLSVKQTYIQSKQERFDFLKLKNRISEREREVANLLARGLSSKSISEQLHISFNTVESHRKNLLQKLEAKNTAELIYKFNQI